MLTKSITDVAPSTYKLFSCGILELDTYLQRYAKNNHKKGVGKTFLLIQSNTVVGYYTISMGDVEYLHVPEKYRAGLPKYPIPIARIGRLAVDSACQNKGFGRLLLLDALERIWEASQIIAAFGVVVDAKNQEAKSFYEHHDFIPYFDESLSLFLPIASLDYLFINSERS